VKKYRQQLRWAGIVAASVFLLAFLCFISLDITYFDSRPKEPHPEIGLTIPHAVKGRTVYVSEAEAEISYWSYWVFIGALCTLAACGVLSGGNLDMRRKNSN
jgi:hypothetical protein